jgi:hypothetical protein
MRSMSRKAGSNLGEDAADKAMNALAKSTATKYSWTRFAAKSVWASEMARRWGYEGPPGYGGPGKGTLGEA